VEAGLMQRELNAVSEAAQRSNAKLRCMSYPTVYPAPRVPCSNLASLMQMLAVLELRARARARAAEEELCALGEERDRLAPQVEEARWHARRADKDAAAARAERDASGQARRGAAPRPAAPAPLRPARMRRRAGPPLRQACSQCFR
jgi:hypothetical protein